jgi:capsular exopolysaccharide synthesis family protein
MEKIQVALEKARQKRAVALDSGGRAGERGAVRRLPVGGGADLESIPVVPASMGQMRRHRIVSMAGRGAALEAFRMLRTHVLNRLNAIGGRSVAITSPEQGEGKTFVAVNLAIVLAQLAERSALLIDADLRRPSVCRCLGIQPTGELSDCLVGERALDECLIRPGIDDLVLLPQRKAVQRSSELLASPRMTALTEELKARFPDHILVFDCPPLLVADDPLVVQRLVEGVLVVIQEGATTRASLTRAAEIIGEERYLGSVMNNAQWESVPSYYS